MMLANLERLPEKTKVELGRRLLRSLTRSKPSARELWSLSRFGARRPMYGPIDRVVAPESAANWADTLLAAQPAPSERTARALVLLTERTGDRARDVDDAVRARVDAWLGQLEHAERFRDLLNNPDSAFREEEESFIFGESLPAGLVLTEAAA